MKELVERMPSRAASGEGRVVGATLRGRELGGSLSNCDPVTALWCRRDETSRPKSTNIRAQAVWREWSRLGAESREMGIVEF